MSRAICLPFCFDAEVVPSHRHRKVQEVRIREYVYVSIREVDPADFPVAIRSSLEERICIGEPVPGPIHKLGERLYRPSVDMRTARPLDLDTFETAVSTRNDPSPVKPHEPNKTSTFDRRRFPTPGFRLGVDAPNPLDHWTEGDCAILGGWTPTKRFVRSTREDELVAAHGHLAEAVVSVGGWVFVACPEPTWSVDRYLADRVRVRLDPWPSHAIPHTSFRLDRLEEARDWARWLGGDDVAPHEVEIVDPTALTRDDEWSLARWVVQRFSLWSRRCEHEEEAEDACAFEKFVDGIRREKREVRLEEVEDLLEGLPGFLAGVDPDHPHLGDWIRAHLQEIAERWRVATAAGRGFGNRFRLSDEDADALYGL